MPAPDEALPFERRAQELAQAFDQAGQKALLEAGLEQVYLSPLWESYTTSPPTEARAWKRSVLRRRPGAGAEPWGHVFLVVTRAAKADPSVAVSEEAAPLTGPRAALAISRPLPLHKGPPSAWMLLRPRSTETRDRLAAFGEALLRAFTPGQG